MSDRTIACVLAAAVGLGLFFQFAPHVFSHLVLSQVAQSHIDGNIPKGKLFDEYLKRDLTAYFCEGSENCSVAYELLRDAPTQSGIAYPKYYAWIKVTRGQKVESEGPVRVAAVDQKQFDVREFVTREEIIRNPSVLADIFPAAIIDKIKKKAGAR